MQIGVGNSGLPFRNIKSYQGQLAIGLTTWGHIEVRVTNLDGVQTTVMTWTVTANLLELACYDSRGFTFISSASGSAYLLNAKP